MTTTALATQPAPLGPKKLNLLAGQRHPYTIADTWTISVQCVRFDLAYEVTVYQRTLRLHDLCGSYKTEQEACAVARAYCQMFLMEVQP